MLTTVKTIYGGLLQTCNMLGIPYVPPTNSTLNEIWNIHVNTPVAANDRFAAEYFCIGNGGHRYTVDGNLIPYPETVPHEMTDGSLYKHLPFVLRPVNSDLAQVDRARYGMRVLVTIAGVKYWAYYLRRLDLSNTTPQAKITQNTNGVSSDTAFIPDNSTLTPVQPQVDSNGVISTNGQFGSVSALVETAFTPADTAELLNVAEILFGRQELAIVSEIGLVSAIRKPVPLYDVNGAELTGNNYYEALRATVMDYIGADWSAYNNQNGFTLTLNLGTSDPMFGTTQLTVQSGG
jgi:hypothetical protein